MADTYSLDLPPRPFSLFRLVVDQVRVSPEVEDYRYNGRGTEDDPYIITFIPDDPGNPMTWAPGKKWIITMIVAVETLATAFASSAFSGTTRELLAEFDTSVVLMTAGISLFVLGFALGPLLWAPLSEIYGRQVIYLITFGAYTVFSAGSIAAQNIETLLVMRFFAGAFGSSPFTNAGGVIADIFPASERGPAMGVFALAPSLGPTLGPLCGGFLGENQGWRWVMGLLTIFSGFMWIVGVLFVPETYAPVILRKRAEAMSKATGRVYMLQSEKEKGRTSVGEVMKTSLGRPWVLLFFEPIVLLLSIYVAIIYGTLYLLFGAYPLVFQIERGWGEGVGGLPFLGIALGMFFGIMFCGYGNKRYIRVAELNGGVAPPEARLNEIFYGAIAIPLGMFWFAWTNGSEVHWASPVLAGIPFGFGFNVVFLGVTNYLIDGYTIFAASVLAANTVLRSLFGAAFPLFTQEMFASVGLHWGASIPAFLALACVPFPFIFYKYGAAIRSRCIYASQSEAVMDQLRAAQASAPTEPAAAPVARGRAHHDPESTLYSCSLSVNTFDDVELEKDHFHEDHSRVMSPQAAHKGEYDLQDFSRMVSHRFSLPVSRAPSRAYRPRAGSIPEAANYQFSPYDIDRINTAQSVAGVDIKRKFSSATRR